MKLFVFKHLSIQNFLLGLKYSYYKLKRSMPENVFYIVYNTSISIHI
nr:hypothetical protein CJLB15_00040 [Campylobacter phage CJLB-15]